MSDLVAQRRMQIVNAAESVISEKGLQRLSLAEIEKKAGMSRGQLTYYFPTKEEILLAVFDRCVENIHRRIAIPLEIVSKSGVKGWSLVREVISVAVNELLNDVPFYFLEYTFLAQVGSRPDFTKRLCQLYAEWRNRMGIDMQPDFPSDEMGNLMVIIQAFLHGLAIQKLVDPEKINSKSAGNLFLTILDHFVAKRQMPAETFRYQDICEQGKSNHREKAHGA